ncbi:MAG: hypothetical protein AAFN70_08855 [Planctomycetota bacterium]
MEYLLNDKAKTITFAQVLIDFDREMKEINHKYSKFSNFLKGSTL